MNKQRLLKLAKHLESGVENQFHKKFDFGTYHSPCGTAGCALGECPLAFPRHWKWDNQGSTPILRGNDYAIAMQDAAEFFDIAMHEVEYLFYPVFNNPLGRNATRREVAAHIRKFVKSGGIYAS